MKKFAMVFPGQGAQFPGMANQYAAHPQVAETLAEASDAVSADLKGMAESSSSEADLRRTENTQPAMLAMDVGVFRAFESAGAGAPEALAGHSLGEYAALVCGGAMAFADAMRAARFRGQAMARAAPPGAGGISAVIGPGPEEVDEVCAALRGSGAKVWAANYNSPAQTVIAGAAESVARAAEELKRRGAKKIAPLPMSAPSHCPLMSPAADELAEFLGGVQFQNPRVPILHNKTAAEAPSSGDIPELLRGQVVSPVLWVDTVRALAARAECVLECGPGRTLSALGKRIAPQAKHMALESSAALGECARALGDG